MGLAEKTLPTDARVRYLFAPGELEGEVQRATDPIWSLKTFKLDRAMAKPGQLVLHQLRHGPTHSFVREEFMVVPPDSELPAAAPD